ncbi:hypothetical protein VaNZ11_010886 [Volvox africanus]|uniref:GLTSCR protein conserved domain-containing protein n=1 Tax=Volvox africanus TaxID=51714 RepID=A0ABQ5SBS4_9CHLO|nr:hypothetical protein VaNZ11_010886 [Volvox africanus]
MSKPSTPVRRSKVGPGRPGSAAGGEIPLTASMEVLTPDPCVAPHMAASELGRSQELHVAPVGSKPRTPSSATLIRTRSTDGRRVSGPHDVIPLNSTTSKSFSANQILAHPLVLATQAGSSPACSVVGTPGVILPPPQSPYLGGPAPGGMTPSGAGISGSHATLPPGARLRTPQDIMASTVSSRFNPVTEGDDDMPPMRESQVVLDGSATAVMQRVAAAAAVAGTSSTRRYAAEESVALSQQQQWPQTGKVGREEDVGGSCGGKVLRLQEESEVPGTPGSVASGRVGGVFFTDLHRSFGGNARRSGVSDSQDLRGALAADEEWPVEGNDDESDGLVSDATPHTRISTIISKLNPMQSPTTSEDGDDGDEDSFAEYAGEGLRSGREAGSGMAEVAGDRRTSTSALTDYTNPVQTPYDSRLPTPLLPSDGSKEPASAGPPGASLETAPAASLLLVIHDLYVTDSEPRTPADTSRPTTAASEPPAQTPVIPEQQPQPAPEEGGEGDEVLMDESAALSASRAAVAALAAGTEMEQSQRRSELGEYMTSLQELKDESGGRLVELPADWGVMLERLFRQRRAQFETLQGWMGPRRFEDLPVNQLPSNHPDPRVEEGLARIRELDAVLNDKLIAALISHRETFPDQWAEQERKRLERHTKTVEEALKRERQKRLRAAQISRAVTSLDGLEVQAASPLAQGSSRSLAAQPSSVYSRLFTLKPEEEKLVEAVLARNDDEGAAINPFDLESAATYGNMPDGGSATGVADDDGEAVADPDKIDLELDMMLPSASASACTTPSAAAPLPRPLSARLTEADSGAGAGLRPLSASSYSSSRPGTSSGLAGGMSPLAAAALHGHPALLAAAFAGAAAGTRASAAGDGGGGLLPERLYDDPRAAARALRAINARLAAFESEHLWDERGALADFKSISSAQQKGANQKQQPETEASVGPGSAGAAVGVQSSHGGQRAASPPRSLRSVAGGPAASVTGASVTKTGQRDYLREERLAKELATRERDVDAALRSLKTGEVVRLGEATLKALVEQCRRLQELNEHRRKIEEAEAAARRAQLMRQQLMASRASESGSGKGTPKGGHAPGTTGSGCRGQAPQPAPADQARGAGPATDAGNGRGTKPATAAAATSASTAAGSGGGGTTKRQSSAGKTRSGDSLPSAGSGPTAPTPSSRRASDPASAAPGGGSAAAGGGNGTGPATTNSGSGIPKSGKAPSAPAQTASVASTSASAASVGAAVPKPRSAGKSGGSPLQPDGRGLLPPPPPPPPPP